MLSIILTILGYWLLLGVFVSIIMVLFLGFAILTGELVDRAVYWNKKWKT
jgi:hypothetical protein